MERKPPNKPSKPLSVTRPTPAIPRTINRLNKEEKKLPQIQVKKQEIVPKMIKTDKTPPMRKNSCEQPTAEEIQNLKKKILKNAEVIPNQTIKSLMSTYNKNRLEILNLKDEQKSFQSSISKLELLQGFVISEIEFYLAQNQEDPEPEYTYEELLELGDQIGKVSQGFSSDILCNIETSTLTVSSQCSICLSQMEPGEQAVVLDPCSHPYHDECIKSWLSDHKTCPLCLQEVILT